MLWLRWYEWLQPDRNRIWSFLKKHGIVLIALLTWISVWTVVFSAIDFWTIKLYHVEESLWFQDYRAVMRYGAAWASPPSFALAENTYFLWMSAFDKGRTMHEWEWYSGNPANPDGHWNFVWGDPHGWTKFPVWLWYLLWLIPTIAWLVGVVFAARRLWGRSLRAENLGFPLVTAVAPAMATSEEEQS